MLDKADFFEEQIKECKAAAQSADKNDRKFWLKMARRWEGLLQARRLSGAGAETGREFRFQRRVA